MPTLADLNDVFADLQQRADEYGPPDFLAGLSAGDEARRSRWHPVRAASGAIAVAAAVAALAVAVPLTATHHTAGRGEVGPAQHVTATPTTKQAPGSRGLDLRRMSFVLDPVNGFTEIQTASFSDRQQRLMYYYGTGERFAVAVYAPDGFVPPRPAGASTERVLGRPGFYGVLRGLPGHQRGAAPVGLAVQVTPDRWITVVAAQVGGADNRSVPLPIARTLAAAVLLKPAPLAVPVRLAAAPPGLVLQASFGGAGEFRSTPSDPGETAYSVEYARPGASGTALSIDVERWRGGPWNGRHFTVDGHPAVQDKTSVTTRVDAYAVSLTTDTAPAAVTRSQLVTIAKGLRFATSFTDPRTWFDASVALP